MTGREYPVGANPGVCRKSYDWWGIWFAIVGSVCVIIVCTWARNPMCQAQPNADPRTDRPMQSCQRR